VTGGTDWCLAGLTGAPDFRALVIDISLWSTAMPPG